MRVASRATKIVRLCGKLSFAKANAAIVDENVPTTTTSTVTMVLFSRPVASGATSQISA